MIRHVLNLAITMVLLFAFNAFDWLTLSHGGMRTDWHHLPGPVIGSVLLVAVVLRVVSVVTEFLYGISILLTLGIALAAYPFIGWAVLAATAHFMPDTLTTHGFWITLLCGWLLMIVKLPASEKADA